jgi:selenocysteine lyase/cysteine desulfurase
MCGPEGAAIFYAAAEHREELEVIESGWTNIERRGRFIECSFDLLPDARRFEAGSLNTNGIYGLRAGIELLLEIGIEAIAEEAIRIATRLADGLESIGWRLGTPRPIRSAIIGASPPGVDGREVLRLHGLLEKEGVVCAPREGMLRVSPHFYNSDEEVDRIVDLLRA